MEDADLEDLGNGVARQVHAEIRGDVNRLFVPEMQLLIRKWATLRTLHTQDIELLHTDLTNAIDPQSAYHTVAARGLVAAADQQRAGPGAVKSLKKETPRAVKSIQSCFFKLRKKN